MILELASLALTAPLPHALDAQQRPAGRSPGRPAALAFAHVTVVDVTSGQLQTDQTVVVAGPRIRVVGPAARVPLVRGARVVDARGKYLIPGLWDMHFHSMGRPLGPFYAVLIANGITGIRDPQLWIPLDTVRQWRRDVAHGVRIGPRQVVAGSALQAANMFAGFNTAGVFTVGGQPFDGAYLAQVQARTPAEARHVIDSLHRAGSDFIKNKDDDMSRETFFAALAEAKRLGTRLEGHLPYSVTMAEASDSGMHVFDHLAQLMGAFGPSQLTGICQGDSASLAKCTALAARLRRNGTWIEIGPTPHGNVAVRSSLPSLPDSLRHPSLQADSAARRRWCPVLGLMARSGMPLLSGTDVNGGDLAGGLPTSLTHEELAFAVGCGLTPLEALQTATLNPAQYLRGTDSLGTITPGKLADLVLLDANPLADITNTTTIRAVVANGRYFDRRALDALLGDAVREAREFARAHGTAP